MLRLLYMFLSRGVDYPPLFCLNIPFLRMVDYMYYVWFGRLFLLCQRKYEFQSATLIIFGGDVAAVDNNGIFYDSQP